MLWRRLFFLAIPNWWFRRLGWNSCLSQSVSYSHTGLSLCVHSNFSLVGRGLFCFAEVTIDAQQEMIFVPFHFSTLFCFSLFHCSRKHTKCRLIRRKSSKKLFLFAKSWIPKIIQKSEVNLSLVGSSRRIVYQGAFCKNLMLFSRGSMRNIFVAKITAEMARCSSSDISRDRYGQL